MALLDTAVSKLRSNVSEAKTTAWVQTGLEKLSAVVIPALPANFQPAAKDGAAALALATPALGTITHEGFLQITSLIALDQEEEARLVFLRERASHTERMSALDAAMGASLDAKASSDAAWASIRSAALSLLAGMGKAAIPLLLAML